MKAGPGAREDARLRGEILRWYLKHRRDLPWRRTRDPYAIWVSEIMLQQTRVETVIPYFARFLDRFPDVAALARAREPDILSAWSGLGYYSRARNLRAAAAFLVRERGGRIPEEPSALREMPGVGEYTAAAIASVAFGKPAAAIDGNVIRVLSRIAGLKGRRDSASLRREVARRAIALARGRRPGDWTQALMELGALICLPRDPLCTSCPARARCRAAKSGHPDRYPEAAAAPKPKSEHRVMLVARRKGRVLLVPEVGAPGGTLTLPTATVVSRSLSHGGAAGQATLAAAGRRAVRALARRVGQEGVPIGPAVNFRHRTFSHDLRVEVWEMDSRGGAAGGRWVPPGHLQKMPVRSPTLKALKKLRG